MPARSELALLALAVGAAGCDSVFGLDDQPRPCALATFEGKAAVSIGEAEGFSIDWDQTFAIVQSRGIDYQMSLPDGTRTPIDLGTYVHLGFALTPEANALFYTNAAEPYVLTGALRDSSAWHLGATVPPGAMAGTPSADAFGPRRLFIRVRMTDASMQEYEDQDGVWAPIGEPLPSTSFLPPNLTPNGLTMVYAADDEVGNPGVYAAQRAAMDVPFGEPVLLVSGRFHNPQLCGKCQQLYVIDDDGIFAPPGAQEATLARIDQ